MPPLRYSPEAGDELFADPQMAMELALQNRGYSLMNPIAKSLMRKSGALGPLSYVTRGGGPAGSSNPMGAFPGMIDDFINYRTTGQRGNSPYDFSASALQSGVQGLINGGADDPRQGWLRYGGKPQAEATNEEALNRLQALESLQYMNDLPGIRGAMASRRSDQFRDYTRDSLRADNPYIGEYLYYALGRPTPAAPSGPPGNGATTPSTGSGSGSGASVPNGPPTTPAAPTPGSTNGGGGGNTGQGSPAAQSLLAILQAAGIRDFGSTGRRQGLGTGHISAPATTNFSAGDYDYTAPEDTDRTFAKGKVGGQGSAINRALYRFATLKAANPGMDEMILWNKAVEDVINANTEGKTRGEVGTGFRKKKPAAAGANTAARSQAY